MSQIFEAPQHAEEERLQRNKSAEEQRSFQGRISDRTRTDRRSARTCSRTSTRYARSGRCGFATSGGNRQNTSRRHGNEDPG